MFKPPLDALDKKTSARQPTLLICTLCKGEIAQSSQEANESGKNKSGAVCFLTCTGLDRCEHDALRLEKGNGFLALREDLKLQRPNPRAQLQGLETGRGVFNRARLLEADMRM